MLSLTSDLQRIFKKTICKLNILQTSRSVSYSSVSLSDPEFHYSIHKFKIIWEFYWLKIQFYVIVFHSKRTKSNDPHTNGAFKAQLTNSPDQTSVGLLATESPFKRPPNRNLEHTKFKPQKGGCFLVTYILNKNNFNTITTIPGISIFISLRFICSLFNWKLNYFKIQGIHFAS